MSLPSVTASDELLAEQAIILEQIVRGAPLREILAQLCKAVEVHAGNAVRATIQLAGERDVTPPGVVTAAWSMPILSSIGAELGTFRMHFAEPREPSPHERRLVEVAVRGAALAIERHCTDRALYESSRRLQFLAELHAATQGLSEPDDLMQTTARMLAEHLAADRCAYAEIEDERTFVIIGDHARGVPSIVGRWEVRAFGAACVEAMLAGRPFVVDDCTADPRIGPAELPAYQATTIRAVICVPLHKGGRFIGAMAVHQNAPRHWSADEIELVTLVVARCWETLERARVTRNLRESEARYRRMVEATPECVKVVAADGALLQMNAAGLRMIGAEEADAIGSNVYTMIAPEHRDRYRRFNERVCRGESGVLEFDIIGLDGTRRTMESTSVPLPSGDGGYVQLAITRDATARVAADRALAQSHARLEYAVRLSGIGFWYNDLPFGRLVWDDRVRAHFFLPPDADVTFDAFMDRIHPEDRDRVRAAIEMSLGQHTPYDVAYRTVDPVSGATKWIRALGGAAYGADGTPLQFDGVTVDVTAQKLDEERIGRLADAALAIHSAGSLDDVLRVITEEARHIVGAHMGVSSLTTSEDCAQTINSVSLSDKYARYRSYDETTTNQGIYAGVLRTNRPMRLTQAELEAHPRWRNYSGHVGHPPLRGWLAVPFVASDGANLGMIQLSDKYDGEFTAADEAVLVQLAQLASVAIENVRLYEQLREQDRRKDEFLATLAHELRNPLAPIRTGLHLLQHSPERSDKVLPMMERQLVHLVRMVDDLLDISRVTLGKITLEKQRVDLRSVLDSALETARPLVEAGNHELAIRLPGDALPLEVDPTRMSQVFANLINNAAKYTPSGGRITIKAAVSGSTLEVAVRDTGTGIPEEMLPRVFDMFMQVGRSLDRSQGGLGIGLTLVRRLVEMHGGSVEAASAGIGQGSTFTVRLPLALPVHAPAPRAGVAEPAAASSALRVLVVDDNIDAAETLAMLLEVGGNLTRLAHSGTDALTAAAEFAPDIVFLDIGLPEMDGYEVATRLRADHSLRQPVLVALTGWGSEDDRRQAHAAGFDRHLVKPIDSAKLDEVLTSARS